LRQIDTLEFRNWFRNSKVVDSGGEPLVVHHGTAAGEFTQFEHRSGLRSGFLGSQRQVSSAAHFFTPSKEMAWEFARNRSGEGQYGRTPTVISAWLRLENPLDLTRKTPQVAKILQSAGMDLRKAFGIKAGAEYVERFDYWAGELKKAEEQLAAAPGDEAFEAKVEHVREIAERTRLAAEPFLVPSNLDFKAEDLWAVGEHPEVVAALEAMGYDGLIISERVSAKTFGAGEDARISYAVFDSSQVKSTKNRGAFDPADPDITR
jgi:hypothetical protein